MNILFYTHMYTEKVKEKENKNRYIPWITNSESLLASYSLIASCNSIWDDNVHGSLSSSTHFNVNTWIHGNLFIIFIGFFYLELAIQCLLLMSLINCDYSFGLYLIWWKSTNSLYFSAQLVIGYRFWDVSDHNFPIVCRF